MIIGHKIFHIIDQFKRRDEKNKVALAVELSIVWGLKSIFDGHKTSLLCY